MYGVLSLCMALLILDVCFLAVRYLLLHFVRYVFICLFPSPRFFMSSARYFVRRLCLYVGNLSPCIYVLRACLLYVCFRRLVISLVRSLFLHVCMSFVRSLLRSLFFMVLSLFVSFVRDVFSCNLFVYVFNSLLFLALCSSFFNGVFRYVVR